MVPPNLPSSGIPKPSGGPPLPVVLYALCLVPITAFAGWVVTYGQDEAALEEKLRAKYGPEIHQIEGKRKQMSEVYMAAIKNPGSDQEQDRRLQEILRGGRGEAKRHYAIDPKYYGTEEGKELQLQTQEEMHQRREEERKKLKQIKRELKKLKKKKQQEEEAGEKGESSSSGTESEEAKLSSRKKMAAAAGAAFAAAVASSRVKKSKTASEEPSPAVPSGEEKEGRGPSPLDFSQIATLTAVAGAAALVGFLVGGGSRRQ